MEFIQRKSREKIIIFTKVTADLTNDLIFQTRRSTDFIACLLSEFGYPAISIHGGRYPNQRIEAVSSFEKGTYKILVSTALNIGSCGDTCMIFDMPINSKELFIMTGKFAKKKLKNVRNLKNTNFIDGKRKVSCIVDD